MHSHNRGNRRVVGARSGRHRRGAVARALSATSDWFHEPHDYEWIMKHRSTRPLQSIVRFVFAAATGAYAATSVLMLFSSDGPSGTIEQSWVLFVLLVQVLVIIRWVTGPLPGKRGFIAFGIFADVASTSVLMLYSPVAALTGTVLFAVTGAFYTYFLSPRLLAAHLVWAMGTISWFGIRCLFDTTFDTPAVITGWAALLVATIGVPVFAQVAWTALSNDAKRSILDPLTGLLNRRGVESELRDLWHVALGGGLSLAVVVVDIDNFKTVNDRFGHDRGDAVIVSAAHQLQAVLGGRPGVVARTGGEEYLVALTGDSEDLEEAVRGFMLALRVPGSDVSITVSVGVALLQRSSPLWRVGTGVVSRATRVADEAMYRAKRAGGDRIELARI